MYALFTLTALTFWYLFFFILALIIEFLIEFEWTYPVFILLTLKRGRGGFTYGCMIAGRRILGNKFVLFAYMNFFYNFYRYLKGMSSESFSPSVSEAELWSSSSEFFLFPCFLFEVEFYFVSYFFILPMKFKQF